MTSTGYTNGSGSATTQAAARRLAEKALKADGKVDWDHVDTDIERNGTKIILPNDPTAMPIPHAIAALERKMADEEQIMAVREVIEAYPLDGAVAFMYALKAKYGWASPIPTPGFFGPEPPEMLTVDTGPNPADKIQVPWGRFMVPGIEKPIDTGVTRTEFGPAFMLTGSLRKKEVHVLKELAALTREIVREHSIYRGKAIRLRTDEGTGDLNPKVPPTFIQTAHTKPEELIFSGPVQALVDTNIYTLIKRTDVCRKAGIPRKRGVLLEGQFGVGKCLAKDTPVLMFDGRVMKVQDIKEGDLLMGPDSTSRRVLSLARGRERMYRVTPRKGDSYTVNASHILSLKVASEWSAKGRGKQGDVVNMTVSEFDQLTPFEQQGLVGWRAGVDFPYQDVALDPYFVGLWLGDGNSRNPWITTADPEVEATVRDTAAQYGLMVRTSKPTGLNNKSMTYCISAGPSQVESKGSGGRNTVLTGLQEYDLIRNKHIPRQYRVNSREMRLRLLAGLADSDGHKTTNGSLEIATKFDRLADDILYLCRSLGLAAYKKAKVVATASGDKTYWRIIASGDLSVIPTQLARKQFKPRQQVKDVLRTRISVEQLPEDDYYGFSIDGDRLFMLGDFTVTHNTMCATVTAKLCVENSWTFIMLDRASSLRQALEFAKRYQPAVVFAEDIDRSTSERDEKANDLSLVLDGMLSKDAEVMVVLTTNNVERIHPVMLRPGRLDAVISVTPPDAKAVEGLIRLYARKTLPDGTSLTKIGEQLAGSIPAVIREVVERSKLAMIARGGETLAEEDLIVSATGMQQHMALLNKPKTTEMDPMTRIGHDIGKIIAATVMGGSEITATAVTREVRNAAGSVGNAVAEAERNIRAGVGVVKEDTAKIRSVVAR
jgi:Hom_end-associated Hint/ATPase family associated with various cellular activities (AAA)/Homing endonuclease